MPRSKKTPGADQYLDRIKTIAATRPELLSHDEIKALADGALTSAPKTRKKRRKRRKKRAAAKKTSKPAKKRLRKITPTLEQALKDELARMKKSKKKAAKKKAAPNLDDGLI